MKYKCVAPNCKKYNPEIPCKYWLFGWIYCPKVKRENKEQK